MKHEEDVTQSISLFWNYYFSHSNECVIENMIESVRDFRTFLNTIVFDRMDFCEEAYIITDDSHKRTKKYPNLYSLLDSYDGVHDKDIQIVLDAHDFSKTLKNPLDFITFDKKFYNGVVNTKLSFNKVNSLKDYNFIT